MSLGWKREYESDALALFTDAVRIIAADHPEDAALQAFAKKAQLTTIMVLADEKRELNMPGSNILKDRLSDCLECQRREGTKPCIKDGTRGPCIYKSPKYALQAIEKHLGKGAFDLISKYIPE